MLHPFWYTHKVNLTNTLKTAQNAVVLLFMTNVHRIPTIISNSHLAGLNDYCRFYGVSEAFLESYYNACH